MLICCGCEEELYSSFRQDWIEFLLGCIESLSDGGVVVKAEEEEEEQEDVVDPWGDEGGKEKGVDAEKVGGDAEVDEGDAEGEHDADAK